MDATLADRAVDFGRRNNLYTAVYAVLADAKADRRLAKLYKGSHMSRQPHEQVLAFQSFFAESHRGLLGYACRRKRRPTVADLDVFDARYQPRLPMREVFDALLTGAGHTSGSPDSLLHRLVEQTHQLGAYRGGSSGLDEEARAVAAVHFRQLGIAATVATVQVFAGGAKGILLAFCAALMCQRRHDDLHHRGGVLLAPEGYYQGLRLIPAIFGGEIHVVGDLTGTEVQGWLAHTADLPARAIYAPLVNNATGRVLEAPQARAIAAAVKRHNALNLGNPAYVIGDDVYVGSYLDRDAAPMPIGAVPGMGQWTVSLVSPSKTFALPTARVAFATTTNPALREALSHYRTVFSHGRVPQLTELAAAAALAFTPSTWIASWNQRYRERLHELDAALKTINDELGRPVFGVDLPQGGWYVRLRIARDLFPVPISSGVDAAAILLHYGGRRRDTGLGLLPGELFGQRLAQGDPKVGLRATLAIPDDEFHRAIDRFRDATRILCGPHGPELAEAALRRARDIADLDDIVAHLRY